MRKSIALLLPLLLLGAGCTTTTGGDVDVQTETDVSQTNTITDTNTAPTPAEEETPADQAMTAVVTITAGGFNPSILTVKAGTTVTFTNNDIIGHWVASNPHPSHTGLAGFDAKAAVAALGGTYSYTFTKTGSFGYHDHLNPSLTGTVVVQ